MAEIAICDANILIDFVKADKQVIAKITELYEKVKAEKEDKENDFVLFYSFVA